MESTLRSGMVQNLGTRPVRYYLFLPGPAGHRQTANLGYKVPADLYLDAVSVSTPETASVRADVVMTWFAVSPKDWG